MCSVRKSNRHIFTLLVYDRMGHRFAVDLHLFLQNIVSHHVLHEYCVFNYSRTFVIFFKEHSFASKKQVIQQNQMWDEYDPKLELLFCLQYISWNLSTNSLLFCATFSRAVRMQMIATIIWCCLQNLKYYNLHPFVSYHQPHMCAPARRTKTAALALMWQICWTWKKKKNNIKNKMPTSTLSPRSCDVKWPHEYKSVRLLNISVSQIYHSIKRKWSSTGQKIGTIFACTYHD